MNDKVITIAEAGVNHNGRMDLARQLVDLGAAAGVDYVKFQTFVTEEVVGKDAPLAEYQKRNEGRSENQYDMIKRLELSFEDFRQLKQYCERKGVRFLSTPDDALSLDFLVDDLGMELIKVGSGEVTNLPFLRRVGKKGKDVILSTGMAGLGEVETAFGTLRNAGAPSVALLHCTSNYPAPFDTVNLRAMRVLKSAFQTMVGYSDHTEGIAVSIAAVALGAEIVEKHFTIDRTLPGPDHLASMSPDELHRWVREIRNTEMALSGSGRKEMQASEKDTKAVVSRGIYLREDAPEGTILTEDLLVFKRPTGDLGAGQVDLILGRRLNTRLQKGQALALKYVNFEQ